MASLDGRWGDTASYMMEAVAIWNELGNERSACNDEFNVGSSLSQLGEYEQSIAVLRSCLTRAARVGLEVGGFCDAALAVALARNGDINRAKQIFDDLPAVSGDKYMEAMNTIYRAWFQIEIDRPEAARQLAERAMEIADRDTFGQVFAFAAAIRGHSLLALERPQEALQATRQGMEVLRSLGRLDEGEMLLCLAHAEALWAMEIAVRRPLASSMRRGSSSCLAPTPSPIRTGATVS